MIRACLVWVKLRYGSSSQPYLALSPGITTWQLKNYRQRNKRISIGVDWNMALLGRNVERDIAILSHYLESRDSLVVCEEYQIGKERLRQILRKFARLLNSESPRFDDSPIYGVQFNQYDPHVYLDELTRILRGEVGRFTWLHPVNTRASNALVSTGSIHNAKDLKRAIVSGELKSGSFQGKKLRNFGEKSYNECCDLVGLVRRKG